MARIRAIKEQGGRAVVVWTPRKGRRPPAQALWEVTVSIGRDSTGRYRQRSERVRGTLTQARERAAQLERKYGSGHRAAEAPGTFNEAVAAYITYAESTNGRVPKTIIGYRSIARRIDEHGLGRSKLAKLSRPELRAYLSWLRTVRGVSARTAHHHHALICQTLNYCISQEWVEPPGPAAGLKAPEVEPPRADPPTPEEAQLLIRELARRPETRDKAALLLLAGITGCRRGEVCGWRWSDFDLENSGLTVQRAISLGYDGPIEQRTKTRRERRLSVDAKTMAVLATQWEQYAAACRDCALAPDMDSFVFSARTDHSTPLNPNSVTQAFRRLRARMVTALRKQAAAAGDVELKADLNRRAERLARVQLGHFRHFAATQMAGAGIDIKTASGRLGHDGAVFLRHYAGRIDAKDQEAAELLSSLLLPALEPAPSPS